jgi:nucleoside-diphosphate-sugar epimerase
MIFGGRRDANIERLVAWFRGRNWFPIFGDGRNLVQPVFVDDLIEAFVGALANPKGSARQSYTVGGPEPMAYESMLRSIAAACGRPAPWLPKVPLGIALAGAMVVGPILGRRGLTAEQIRRFGEDKTADISAAVRDLGFAPRSFDVAIQAKVAGLPDDL